MMALHDKVSSEYLSKETAGVEDEFYRKEIMKRKKNENFKEEFQKKINIIRDAKGG
jgi:hypothetical protein